MALRRYAVLLAMALAAPGGSANPFGNLNKSTSAGTQFSASSDLKNEISSVGSVNGVYDSDGDLLNNPSSSDTQVNWPDAGGHATMFNYHHAQRSAGSGRPGPPSRREQRGPRAAPVAPPHRFTRAGAPGPAPMNDWLGSERLASTPTGGLYGARTYGPFGESYAQTGSDPRFTGQIAAIATGSYDFLMREYSPTQSRWWTPDPAGLAAADPNDPQSWNQFAYVAGTPLTAVDPLGLDPCENWTDRQGNLHSTRTPFIGGGGGGPTSKGCTAHRNPPGGHAHMFATNFDVNGDRPPHAGARRSAGTGISGPRAGASTGPAQLQPGGAQAGRAAQPRWGPRPSMDANLQDCQPGGSNPSAPAVPISPQLVLPAGPVCVSAAQINSYLAQTPLAGQGQAFYDAGQAYGVNPALAVAIAGAESTFGENVDTTWGLRNTWGWGSTPAPHRIAQGWTTWQQGIYRVTWQLGRPLYLGGGVRTTSAAIYGAWCQSGDCTGGLATINGVLDHFGVNPASLRFKACAEERQ